MVKKVITVEREGDRYEFKHVNTKDDLKEIGYFLRSQRIKWYRGEDSLIGLKTSEGTHLQIVALHQMPNGMVSVNAALRHRVPGDTCDLIRSCVNEGGIVSASYEERGLYPWSLSRSTIDFSAIRSLNCETDEAILEAAW